ncbi:hypothetical protein BJ165DRAFT_581922 [Panaeolus papilionaceus]|nr:hypothetical protein BJ165DRAFT_581922 [Panaeolus papilionaceus]
MLSVSLLLCSISPNIHAFIHVWTGTPRAGLFTGTTLSPPFFTFSLSVSTEFMRVCTSVEDFLSAHPLITLIASPRPLPRTTHSHFLYILLLSFFSISLDLQYRLHMAGLLCSLSGFFIPIATPLTRFCMIFLFVCLFLHI